MPAQKDLTLPLEEQFIGETWELIDDTRLACKLTLHDMAQRLNLAPRWYRMQRRKQSNLTLARVARIAHAMGCRPRITFEDEVK